MNRRILTLGLAAALILAALFCWLQFRPPQVARLEITPGSIHLTPSGAQQLTVTGYLKNGEAATREQLNDLALVWDYEAENGAANFAVYYLMLQEGNFEVMQGIVFDALANESEPWFMAYDLDWDVSNDTPIDEKTANSVIAAGRKIYAAQEYFPYSLYK